jgi:glutaredoxin
MITRSARNIKVKKIRVSFAFTPPDSWEVYTKDGCGYCEKAKKALAGRPNVRIIRGEGNMELQQRMSGINFVTWPKIFLNGKFLGGYSDLEKTLKRKNELV